MLTYLMVGIGGFIGAILRYSISYGVQKITLLNFPLGTLIVNIIGSFLIGILFSYFENVINPNLKLLLITGLLGALTTFSTFSLETFLMLQDGLLEKAFLNIGLNLLLTLFATMAGISIFNNFSVN